MQKTTIDKIGKYLYNFIVTKNNEMIETDIYLYLKQGGNQNGTTKKKMVKSKNS